jgi:hypothetical protein
MVYLHAISHMSDTPSSTLELIGDEADLVAPLDQALSQLVAMGLHSSKFGESKVRADENAVFTVDTLLYAILAEQFLVL